MSTEESYIFKQTCSFHLQVCLSMYDLLVDIRRYMVKLAILMWTLVSKDSKVELFVMLPENIRLSP